MKHPEAIPFKLFLFLRSCLSCSLRHILFRILFWASISAPFSPLHYRHFFRLRTLFEKFSYGKNFAPNLIRSLPWVSYLYKFNRIVWGKTITLGGKKFAPEGKKFSLAGKDFTLEVSLVFIGSSRRRIAHPHSLPKKPFLPFSISSCSSQDIFCANSHRCY